MRSALRLEVSGGRRVGLCPEDQHCSMARLQAGRKGGEFKRTRKKLDCFTSVVYRPWKALQLWPKLGQASHCCGLCWCWLCQPMGEQSPAARCPSFPCSCTADGDLRNHHQVLFVSESAGTRQRTVFYIHGLFSSLLHGEMTRFGRRLSTTSASVVHVVLLCSLGFSCLETPVGLEHRQEGRKMMRQAVTRMGLYLHYQQVQQGCWKYQLPAVQVAFCERNKMPLKPETLLVLNK